MQAADIMLHLQDELDPKAASELESEIHSIPGVIAARFNKPHLLVVSYDPDDLRSETLLSHVQSKGYIAQLVGM
jgi:hypothetical protein